MTPFRRCTDRGVGDRLQFDSTVDGKAIKTASMIDEHTLFSLLNIVERSITPTDSSRRLRRYSPGPAAG